MMSVDIQRSRSRSVIFAVGLAGMVALALATWTGLGSWRLIRGGVVTTGVVVQIIESRGEETRSYRTMFRFRDATGTEHTATSWLGSNRAAHRVKDIVPVIYQPSAPEEARLNSFADLWLIPTIAGGVAALFLSIALFALFRSSGIG